MTNALPSSCTETSANHSVTVFASLWPCGQRVRVVHHGHSSIFMPRAGAKKSAAKKGASPLRRSGVGKSPSQRKRKKRKQQPTRFGDRGSDPSPRMPCFLGEATAAPCAQVDKHTCSAEATEFSSVRQSMKLNHQNKRYFFKGGSWFFCYLVINIDDDFIRLLRRGGTVFRQTQE